MILPRPIVDLTYPEVRDFINKNFVNGEVFELCTGKSEYKFIEVHESNWTVHAHYGKKIEKIGLLKFYSRVKKDIGLIKAIKERSLPAMAWLTSGIDGILNVERLCKAVAMNGELLPRKDEKGKVLSAILMDSNQAIQPIENTEEGLKDAAAAIEFIDANLIKYGTYLEELAKASNVVIKREG